MHTCFNYTFVNSKSLLSDKVSTKAYWKHEQEFIGKLYVARKLLKKFLIRERMPIVSTRFKLSEAFIRKTRSHTITLISYLSEDRSHTDKYKLYRRLWTLSVLSVCEKPKYIILILFYTIVYVTNIRWHKLSRIMRI